MPAGPAGPRAGQGLGSRCVSDLPGSGLMMLIPLGLGIAWESEPLASCLWLPGKTRAPDARLPHRHTHSKDGGSSSHCPFAASEGRDPQRPPPPLPPQTSTRSLTHPCLAQELEVTGGQG